MQVLSFTITYQPLPEHEIPNNITIQKIAENEAKEEAKDEKKDNNNNTNTEKKGKKPAKKNQKVEEPPKPIIANLSLSASYVSLFLFYFFIY